jgi:CheY-like chemotaxis protein
MTNQQPAAQAKKILVVDDNEVIRKAVSLKLKANGYEAFAAVDASATIKMVEQERPDLILLDILFPPDAMGIGMHWDGFAIMRWLRSMSGDRDIPVIIISGTDPAKYKERCLAAGAAAFLHKPLNMDELIATVRTALGEDTANAV